MLWRCIERRWRVSERRVVTVLEREMVASEDVVVYVTWSTREADVVRMAPGETLEVRGRVSGGSVDDVVEAPSRNGDC